MSLRFSCPCGQKLKTPDGSAHKRARCVKCNRWLRIPDSAVYETIAQAVEAPSDAVKPEPTDHGTGEFNAAPLARTLPLPPNNHNKLTAPIILVADSDSSARARTVAMLKEHAYAVIGSATASRPSSRRASRPPTR